MKHIPALTSLRFIAALIVFLSHYLALGGWRHWGEQHSVIWDTPILKLVYEFRYGVTLFFVLSGFLLGGRYLDSIFRKVSFREYWIKRFARIMPLYWVLCMIVFGVSIVKGFELKPFLVYFSLTQGFFSDLKFHGLETAWSLTVEESFYLMLPAAILAIRWQWGMRWKPWLQYTATIATMAGIGVALYQAGRMLHDQEVFKAWGFFGSKSDWRLYTIFGRFFDFAVGIAFGVVYMKSKNGLLRRGWMADVAIAVSTLGVIGMCYVIFNNGGLETPEGWRLNWLNAVFSGIIIYSLCARRSRIAQALSWRPFVYLGEISFALYLVHKSILVNWMYWWTYGEDLPLLTSVAGLYIVFTLFSVLCYEVVERPVQHLILARTVGRGGVRRPTVLRFLTGKRRENVVTA